MMIDNAENRDELTQQIIGCCFEVHNQLGPGFLEKNIRQRLEDKAQTERIEV